MSVLIRNMKMPKCCDVCQFSDWSNLHQTALCKVYDYEPCFEDFSQEYTSKRSNNCPLVELPEKHGRLIDADELKTAFPTCDNSKPILVASVRATINHMPTVIEAEGER